MENFKITIIGNSVSLRVRPVEKYPNNKNYGMLLGELLQKKYPEKCVTIDNKAFGRATLSDTMLQIDDFINTFADLYILNIGVPDASTREIPYWFAQILNNKKYSLKKAFWGLIHKKIFVPKRAFWVKLRGKKTWTTEKKFAQNYEKLVKTLLKETNGQVITMAINPPDERIENSIPGSRESYMQYNQIINKISEKHELPHLTFDDLKSETDYPDGIHYSLTGHKIVANRLFQTIEKNYA